MMDSGAPRASIVTVSYILALLMGAVCLILSRSSSVTLSTIRSLGTAFPYTVSGDELATDLHASGKMIAQKKGFVRIFENASWGYRFEVPVSGNVPLYLVARGSQVDDVYPHLSVRVDRELRSGLFVASGDWGLYRIDLDLSAGEHMVELAFINDASRYPANRDLDLRTVGIGVPPESPEGLIRWHAPGLLQPDRMAFQVLGNTSRDGYHLWDGGSLTDDVFFTESGSMPVALSVRQDASPSDGSLRITVDGNVVDALDTRTARTEILTTRLEMEAGWHRLSFSFQAAEPRCSECDLVIEKIDLGSPGTHSSDRHGLDAAGPPQEDRVLWSNGYVTRAFVTPTADPSTMTLRARGDLCEGVGPRVLVIVDHDQLAILEIDTTTFMDFSTVISVPPGPHEASLVFLNDRSVPGVCDRNLHIDNITFSAESPTLQAAKQGS